MGRIKNNYFFYSKMSPAYRHFTWMFACFFIQYTAYTSVLMKHETTRPHTLTLTFSVKLLRRKFMGVDIILRIANQLI